MSSMSVSTLAASPCIGCGYELDGLAREAVCPECRMPVWRSFLGPGLVHASPEYRAGLVRGISLILLANAMLLLQFVGFIVFVVYFDSKKMMPPGIGAAWFFPLGLLLPNVIGFWGYWLFTTPDVKLASKEKAVSWRKVVRWMVMVQAGGILVEIVLAALGFSANFYPGISGSRLTGAILQLSTMSIVCLAWIVQMVAVVVYCYQLRRRLRDATTNTRLFSRGWVFWLCAVLMFATLPFFAITYFYLGLLWKIRRAIVGLGRAEVVGSLVKT